MAGTTTSSAAAPRKELGQKVKTGKDNGYSGNNAIDKGDPHYGWNLGTFVVNGYTRETSSNGIPVFLKNVGDKVTLWFTLTQDINNLNGKSALTISEDTNGYDQFFEIAQTNFKRGTLIVRYTDYEGNAHDIFFGYTLAELDEQFQGERYVFTLNDNGETTVQHFEDYDDTYDRVIKNVAVGTGVILVCVTVSVVSAGIGAPTISMIFAASAKTGTAFALSSAGFSSIFAGTVTGIQTKDFDQAIKTAALTGSESFKWGAISGALIGGLSKAHILRNTANTIDNIPSPRQSELDVLNQYGGSEQMTYMGGEEVPFGTPGSTRPDIFRMVDNHLEAIEVKNYNLESSKSLNTLYNELERQVSARVANCPSGTTQRIVVANRRTDMNHRRCFSPTI